MEEAEVDEDAEVTVNEIEDQVQCFCSFAAHAAAALTA
jgi:hypothetical protein